MTPRQRRVEANRIVIRVDGDLQSLVPVYLKNRKNDVKAIRTALHRDDFMSIRIIGQEMRDSGAGYGFDKISAIGMTIESCARASDPGGVNKSLDELIFFLKNVEVVYI